MTDFFDNFFDNEYSPEPDRYYTNIDGEIFAGYDDPSENTTAWYSKSGCLDCITPTPDD